MCTDTKPGKAVSGLWNFDKGEIFFRQEFMLNLVIKVQFGRKSFCKLPHRHEFLSHQMGSASRGFGFWVVVGATEWV